MTDFLKQLWAMIESRPTMAAACLGIGFVVGVLSGVAF